MRRVVAGCQWETLEPRIRERGESGWMGRAKCSFPCSLGHSLTHTQHIVYKYPQTRDCPGAPLSMSSTRNPAQEEPMADCGLLRRNGLGCLTWTNRPPSAASAKCYIPPSSSPSILSRPVLAPSGPRGRMCKPRLRVCGSGWSWWPNGMRLDRMRHKRRTVVSRAQFPLAARPVSQFLGLLHLPPD
ncbi:hypothetical protein LZ30DRAFT_79833 [Colletotrichum cereale]|nr:hypothetical protein LZ30DRAFT_79833 [Colletotrichum cereale]